MLSPWHFLYFVHMPPTAPALPRSRPPPLGRLRIFWNSSLSLVFPSFFLLIQEKAMMKLTFHSSRLFSSCSSSSLSIYFSVDLAMCLSVYVYVSVCLPIYLSFFSFYHSFFVTLFLASFLLQKLQAYEHVNRKAVDQFVNLRGTEKEREIAKNLFEKRSKMKKNQKCILVFSFSSLSCHFPRSVSVERDNPNTRRTPSLCIYVCISRLLR